MGALDGWLGGNTDYGAPEFDFGRADRSNPNVDPRLKQSTDVHGAYDYIGPSGTTAQGYVNPAVSDAAQYGEYSRGDRASAQQALGGLGAVAQDYRNYLTGASGPSRAQLLAQQMESQTAANAMGLAASQRGGASAGGTRAAIMAGNQAALQSGAQIGQLRAQEQEAARQGMLGAYGAQAQGYGGLRSQDISGYGAAQQAGQGWYGAALGAEDQRLKNQSTKDQIALGAYQAQTGANSSTAQSNSNTGRWFGIISDENWKQDVTPVSASAGVAPKKDDPTFLESVGQARNAVQTMKSGDGVAKLSGIANLVGTLLPILSDERDKKGIEVESGRRDELAALLDSIEPVAFTYKADAPSGLATPGRHVGVLAQDLERTPAGASMVTQTDRGKVVNAGQAALAALAAAADLNKRLRAVEGRRG